MVSIKFLNQRGLKIMAYRQIMLVIGKGPMPMTIMNIRNKAV